MAVPLLTMEETQLVQSLYDAIMYEAGRSNVCKSGCTVNTSTLPSKIEDIIKNLSKQGKCGLGNKQYYVFETCEELGQFGGTCDCRLEKGDIAVVIDMNGKPVIFVLTDSYTESQVGSCPNDGEVISGTCSNLKWVSISPTDIHAVSAHMSGNTLNIVMNEGDNITVDLPEDKDKYPTGANVQGNTLHITMNEGTDLTTELPVSKPFSPSAFNFDGYIYTTYSPDSTVRIKKTGGSYFEYVVPSDGFYTIQSNMMLSYINADASQHEMDFLSLNHYQYIYIDSISVTKSHIGMGIMAKCNPRSMTSGSTTYSGRLRAGQKVIIKKRTRKCNTAPEKNSLSGYLNITITKLSN